MPLTGTALKRTKINERNRLRSKAVRTHLKTLVSKFRVESQQGDSEAAASALRAASRRLDKAASKGIIHERQAARRKSRIARQFNALSRTS